MLRIVTENCGHQGVAPYFYRPFIPMISDTLPMHENGNYGSQQRKEHFASSAAPDLHYQLPQEDLEGEFFSWESPDMPIREKVYKPESEPATPISDPFPLLSRNPPPKRSLLQAPQINRPPRRHAPERTPLFIGFTRNWPQLLQCVVSYIAAGWPPEDIHVVENTGVMFANRDGRLTLQNPFYLNHTQLAMLGVGVIITPTLLTFAQLQNFYLATALSLDLPYFFWSHQDVMVFSNETATATSPSTSSATSSNRSSSSGSSSSLYANALRALRYLLSPASPRWAHHFFAYDHLTLVNRDAVLAAGAWDTQIAYYASDCDMYVRLMRAGYWQGESDVGIILDVASVMADVGALLRIPGIVARLAGDDIDDGGGDNDGDGGDYDDLFLLRGGGGEEKKKKMMMIKMINERGESWERLLELGYRMERMKYYSGNGDRNTWQARQRGGQGEPFYRDPDGFEQGVRMWIDTGRSVFAEKWGHRGCDIARAGVRPEDAWQLERDWDIETEGMGHQGGSW
ncbi:uncharacterized protein B0T15DRAFT_558611 [Chaetomium strumarium]|uniref:Uncharacterized protein n=1 Tax=Chaetomium strumarium TaxID=1170767 RepID=A0AAJ0M0S4_9PEZI|nr:hypothetical protein B0T15DRAFT_558611 [Chaetomium strumarium]